MSDGWWWYSCKEYKHVEGLQGPPSSLISIDELIRTSEFMDDAQSGTRSEVSLECNRLQRQTIYCCNFESSSLNRFLFLTDSSSLDRVGGTGYTRIEGDLNVVNKGQKIKRPIIERQNTIWKLTRNNKGLRSNNTSTDVETEVENLILLLETDILDMGDV